MSNNVPNISKDMMRQNLNLPEYAESQLCNDHFNEIVALRTDSNVKLEKCETACVKLIAENKCNYLVNHFSPTIVNLRWRSRLIDVHCSQSGIALYLDLRIVIRGCLEKLYPPDAVGIPLYAIPEPFADYCNQQNINDVGIGSTITGSCVCTSDYCNSAFAISQTFFLLIVCLFAFVLL